MSFSLIYIYNFLVTFILLFICKIKQFSKKSYLYVTTIYYLLIFGQRWFGGVDFHGYLEYYLFGIERSFGYGLIQDLFRNNNLYFGVFIFCIYSFTTITSLWFFRKFSNSNLGIFLFFLSEYHIMSLSPLRTYIAINIFLIGIYFWELKRKRIIAAMLMTTSILFHFLAIGGILFYFAFKLINIFKFRYILNCMLLVIPLINLRPVLKISTDTFMPMYSHYFGGYFDQPLSLLNDFRYYIIVFLFLYLQRYLIVENKKDKIILSGMYSFLILMGSATDFGELHRVAYFYKIFEPIFFIYLLDYKKIKKDLRILIISVFILNYIGIIYKDMGSLQYTEIRQLHLFNTQNNQEYLNKVENYFKKYE